MPTSILLDLGALHRRIDRNRDRTGIKDPEEGREKLLARREHERHPVSRKDIALDQAHRDRTRTLGKFPIGHCADNGHIVFQQGHVQTVGVLIDMPLQDVKERMCLSGGRNRRQGRR